MGLAHAVLHDLVHEPALYIRCCLALQLNACDLLTEPTAAIALPHPHRRQPLLSIVLGTSKKRLCLDPTSSRYIL